MSKSVKSEARMLNLNGTSALPSQGFELTHGGADRPLGDQKAKFWADERACFGPKSGHTVVHSWHRVAVTQIPWSV